jgi:hypothetical protein
LQGCDEKNDTPIGIGRGELLHNNRVYQLYNAYLIPPPIVEGGITLDFEAYDFYSHRLILTGTNWGLSTNIIVRTISDRLEPGVFHVHFWTIHNRIVFPTSDHRYLCTSRFPIKNSSSMWINLRDDFVHFAHNFGPSPKKMKLSITEEDGIFDIELRYVECEGNFFIRYRGLVKNRW